MTQTGRGGMGNAKHRKSGRAPKSPKLRENMKREAEKNIVRRRPAMKTKETVKELFHGD